MEQLRYIWLIALKDFKIFATDRAALFFFVVFPFLFVVMFYFLNVGAPSDDRLSYHLVTREAEGGLSHQIIGAIETKDEASLDPGDPIIVWDKDYDTAYQHVEDGELSGFVAFPADFTERVYAGESTQIEVIADSGAVYDAAALEGLAVTVVRKAGDEGRLFGSVGTADIAQAVTDAGHAVEKHEVRLPHGAFRATGEYEVELHLHSGVDALIKVEVVPEE